MAILKFLSRFIVAMVVAFLSGSLGLIAVAILLRFTRYRQNAPGPDDSEWFNSLFLAFPFGVIIAMIVLAWNLRTKDGRALNKQ